MLDVKSALTALKKAAPKAKVKKEITDTIERVSASLPVLTYTTPTSLEYDNLTSRLRRPFLLLYETVAVPALNLSAAIFHEVATKKIAHLLKIGDTEKARRWELVAAAVLSGVLDFLDEQPEEKTKDAIATAFYPVICDAFLPKDPAVAIRLSITLRSTAYTVLSDAAASFPKNQEKLRSSKIMGGKRLGAILYQTKEYLVLESLLTLLGRVIPANTAPNAKKSQRTEFLRQVFFLPCPTGKHAMGKELMDIMENAPMTDWDNTIMTAVDVLARADISNPQPFGLDVIHACAIAFPQPTPSDRLYVDRFSFFANIASEEDAYDTMQVPYTSVLGIAISREHGPPASSVTVTLAVAPTVAEEPMKIPADAPLTFVFDVQNNDLERFMRAIESRGLKARLIEKGKPPKHTRISLTQTSARLEFTSEGDPVNAHPTFEDKVKTVQQIYKTNETSDDVSLLNGATAQSEPAALPLDELINYPATPANGARAPSLSQVTPPPDISNLSRKLDPEAGQMSRVDVTILAPTAPPTPVSNPQRSTVPLSGVGRTDTQILKEKVFGTSEDELSDISDVDDEDDSRKKSKNDDAAGRRSTRSQKASLAGIDEEEATVKTKTARRGRMILESDEEEEGGKELVPQPPKRLLRQRRVVSLDSDVDSPVKEVPVARPVVKTPVRKASVTNAPESAVIPGSVVALLSQGCTGSDVLARAQDKQDGPFDAPAQSPAQHGSVSSPRPEEKSTDKLSTAIPQTGITAKKSVVSEITVANGRSGTTRSTRASVAAVKKDDATGRTKLDEPKRNTRQMAQLPKDDGPSGNENGNGSKQRDTGDTLAADPPPINHAFMVGDRPRHRTYGIKFAQETPRRKRKSFEADDFTGSPGKNAQDAKPAKRARGDSSPKIEVISLTPKRPVPPARKYGLRAKANKASPPVPRKTVSTTNFEAVPGPGLSSDPIEMDPSSPLSQRVAKMQSRLPVKPAPAQTGRMTRAAAMKDRTNRARPVVAAAEQETKKSKTGRKKHVINLDDEEGAAPFEEKKPALALVLDPDAPRTPASKEEHRGVDEIQSSDQDSVEIQPTKAISEVPTSGYTRKPKKAPWETQEFSDMVQQKQTSTPPKIYVDGKQEAHNAEPVDDIPEVPMDFSATGVTYTPRTPSPPPAVVPEDPIDDSPSLHDHIANNAPEIQVELVPSPLPQPKRTSLVKQAKQLEKASKNVDLAAIITKAKERKPAAPFVKVADVEMIDLTTESPVKNPVVFARNAAPAIAPLKKTAVLLKPTDVRVAPEPSPAPLSPVKAPSYHDEEGAVLGSSTPPAENDVPTRESPRPVREKLAEVQPVSARREEDSKEVPSCKRRNRVTFAPEARDNPDTPFNLKNGLLGINATRDKIGIRRAGTSSMPRRGIISTREARDRRQDEQREPGMEAIVEVIVQKISSKVEGVRSEVRVGRKMLLQDAAADLQAMRNESVLHFNRLIDLESEYAGYAHKMVGKWEEMLEVNEGIQGQLRRTIQDHDRRSLVKKMPKTLFVKGLPAVCQKFQA
ncbi:hypothetical protein OE88DRAFT_1642744 [Heliocybe sulcata]|uniref:Uncharacterized protein n=1 Tax=Heliocybe sulcata TaxID=5364 RepID=A0A5C3N9W6_9AGAM|nr:hypothetical protein OE88DRAFT_1642744 [Heliocybe sulcata]